LLRTAYVPTTAFVSDRHDGGRLVALLLAVGLLQFSHEVEKISAMAVVYLKTKGLERVFVTQVDGKRLTRRSARYSYRFQKLLLQPAVIF
jgi:hypothetical protein